MKNDDKTTIQTVKDGITVSFSTFSDEANVLFKKSISKCIDHLFEESTKIKGLHGAQQVSSKDVERASNFLYADQNKPTKDKWKERASQLGYMLIAIALTLIVEITLNQITFTSLATTLSFIFMLSGFILLFLSFKE